MDVKEMEPLFSEQRRELAAAEAMDGDYNLAYRLQMEEAINASLSQSHSGSCSSSSNNIIISDTDFADYSDNGISNIYKLLSQDISDYERRLFDYTTATELSKKFENEINRENHDQSFAKQLLEVPDEEWLKTGELLQKPFFDGSAGINYFRDGLITLSDDDFFRVHVKGLLSEVKKNGDGKYLRGGIGVAVCNMQDEFIVENSKEIYGSEELSYELVELKALVESLHVINTLGLKRVTIVCCSNFLHQCVTGKWHSPDVGSSNSNLVTLLDEVSNLQKKLRYCNASLVQEKDVKFAPELARKALQPQPTSMDTCEMMGEEEEEEEVTIIPIRTEMCRICMGNVPLEQMFTIHDCSHRYCFDCMNKHVQYKLILHPSSTFALPGCPRVGCKMRLRLEDCRKFLNDQLLDMIAEREKEASIPPNDKIYCPVPACSKLMSISELSSQAVIGSSSSSSRHGTMRTCKKCNGQFCMKCKVLWHHNLTCEMYKTMNPYPSREDHLVMNLAASKRWKQCSKCRNMVSLAQGCNHIYCRCGHQFCYVCGAEWKNGKATCGCVLWDERMIINH